ncbi:MAG TPA: hypothetical protein VMS00_04180 [Acidimicrobiales bacterium]|nr:hypothetical protein [Acidimicrobiales bacterium]
MGTEFLVACLWVVVLVYWFWTRLPARADTVGVYRRALRVLEHATPTTVVPAYRLGTPATTSAAAPYAAVALCYKRAQLRRRRRDTLSVLVGAVLLTIAAALLTRSTLVLAAQLVCDLALASYVSLLVRAARASTGAGPARRNVVAVQPSVAAAWPAVYADRSATEEPARLRAPLREAAPPVATYVPAHALRQADLRVVNSLGNESFANESFDNESFDNESFADESFADAGGYTESFGDESYGDFDSYASLALASAR